MHSRNISPRQSRGQILVPVLLTSVLMVQSLVGGYQIWHGYWAGKEEKARQEEIDKKLDKLDKLDKILASVSHSAQSQSNDAVLEGLRADNERLRHQLEEARRVQAVEKAARKAVVVPKRGPRDHSSPGAELLKDAVDSGADSSHGKADER